MVRHLPSYKVVIWHKLALMFILCLTVEIKTTCTPHYYQKHKCYMALYAGEGATNHLFL